MSQQPPIVNKVAQSGLITLDLASFLPTTDVIIFDLKDHLFKGLVLMEKPFRQALKTIDWNQYTDKTVGVTCSADAIIPQWAYMLVATHLAAFTKNIYFGNRKVVEEKLILKGIENIDVRKYEGARIIVKGCGKHEIPSEAFLAISKRLFPYVKSLMYGEPCSTVPIYKGPAK